MSYLGHLKKISGVNQELARVRSVVGDSGGTYLTRVLDNAKTSARPDVSDSYGTLAGAAAGAIIGSRKGHWVLGAFAGASAGRNLPALLNPGDRRDALCNMGETSVAIACSLATPKHPIIAYVVGKILAGAVTSFGGLRG